MLIFLVFTAIPLVKLFKKDDDFNTFWDRWQSRVRFAKFQRALNLLLFLAIQVYCVFLLVMICYIAKDHGGISNNDPNLDKGKQGIPARFCILFALSFSMWWGAGRWSMLYHNQLNAYLAI